MIKQNESRMRPSTQAYGCYGFSLIWWAKELTNIELSAEFIDDQLYSKFLKSGWITDTWFVMNPVAILQYLQVPVKWVRKRPASYRPVDDEICIGQFKADGMISHFVPVDHSGRALYDSWWSKEGGSKAVRDGKLISWRVFRR